MTRNLFATSYTPDFDEARKAYKPPANDSKCDSFKAWQQAKLLRPDQATMLASIKAYDEFISTQTSERAKFRQAPYPRQHFASWIRARGWENETIAQRAQELISAQNALTEIAKTFTETDKSRIEGWSNLRAEIGDAAFGAYFVHATYDEARNALILPKPFLVNLVTARHIHAIHRSFNQDTSVTCL